MLWEKPPEFSLESESWTEACLLAFPENSALTIWQKDKNEVPSGPKAESGIVHGALAWFSIRGSA